MQGWDFGWGTMILGGLVMLLFWTVVIVLAFWAIRALTRTGQDREAGRPPDLHESTALEILKQRYARGEISREEYQEMRRDLET